MTNNRAAASSSAAPRPDDPSEAAIFAKISRHLLPLLLVCYIVAFIDRVNISYAQLGMKQTLPFGNETYAIGAGLFFVGYLLFEIPSNLLLERVGVRRTLLRIMSCWGVVSVATAFVQTPGQLYVLRFLLGVFEAGFFPGIILYLTYWYPPERRGRVFSLLTTAIVFAPIIAGPLSGAILKFCDGMLGFHGWQWLFALQGLPACLLGVVAFRTLADSPRQAAWLTPAERDYVARRLADQTPHKGPVGGSAFRRLLGDPVVWLFALASVMFSGAGYALVFWIPSLISSWGVQDPFRVGLYAVIPSGFALLGMLLFGRSSDRRGDRRWHFVAAASLSATGVAAMALAHGQFGPALAGLCLTMFGQAALLPIYTAIISGHVPRAIAAAGIAFLSCVGHLGSAITPPLVARINGASDGSAGLYLIAAMLVAAGVTIVIALRPRAIVAR